MIFQSKSIQPPALVRAGENSSDHYHLITLDNKALKNRYDLYGSNGQT